MSSQEVQNTSTASCSSTKGKLAQFHIRSHLDFLIYTTRFKAWQELKVNKARLCMQPRCCSRLLHNTGRVWRRPGWNTEEIIQRHSSHSPEEHVLSGVMVFLLGWRHVEEVPLYFHFGRKGTGITEKSGSRLKFTLRLIQVYILFLQDCFKVLRAKYIIKNPRNFSVLQQSHDIREMTPNPQKKTQEDGISRKDFTQQRPFLPLCSLFLFPQSPHLIHTSRFTVFLRDFFLSDLHQTYPGLSHHHPEYPVSVLSSLATIFLQKVKYLFKI